MRHLRRLHGHKRTGDECADPRACHDAYLAYHRENSRLRTERVRRARKAAIAAAREPRLKTIRERAVFAAHQQGRLTLG